MCSYVCVKCGRQCEHYASPSLIKAQMCSVCFNEEKLANEQKEPFKSDYEVNSKEQCRKCGVVLGDGDSIHLQLCSHCWHKKCDTDGTWHVDVGLRCLFCNDVIYKDEPRYRIPGRSSNTVECIKCYLKHQKEPVKFSEIDALIRSKQSEPEVDVPDDVRKVAPKYFSNITDLIRDEARKRAMRNECNGVYKRSADVEVPACGICAKPVSLDMILKTQSGTRICEDCHYKLYHEEPDKPTHVEARYDLIPQRALRAIALVMGKGAIDHNGDDWHTETDFAENMNRAAQHWNLALLGDTEHEASVRDHLSHCIARMMMAYETYKEDSE